MIKIQEKQPQLSSKGRPLDEDTRKWHLSPHLFVKDGHCVLEDDPFDSLAAGRRGQRAIVDEVFLCGVRQETPQGERRKLSALTWTEDKTF